MTVGKSTTDDFSDDDIRAAIIKAGSKSGAARALGISRHALLWRLTKMPDGQAIDGSSDAPSYAIVTACQNNSAVNLKFLEGLRQLAGDLQADLHVIPFRYKNPSAIGNDPVWFDDSIIPHICQKTLHVGLVQIAGDLKVQATTANPCAGLQTMTHGAPLIVGHSQMQLESVPRSQDQPPVWLHSTGAISQPNFSNDTRLGRLAAHNHVYGALVIQVVRNAWWIWQLSATDAGTFIFHEFEYSGKNKRKAGRMEALAVGDSHVAQRDRLVHAATFGQGGIVRTLEPVKGFVHDVFDGLAISHHDAKDPFRTFWKAADGVTCALDELVACAEYLKEVSVLFDELFVVSSNHNDWLERWLKDGRPTPENESLWFDLNAVMRKERNRDKGAFQVWCENHMKDLGNISFLPRGESYLVRDVDYGSHGDEGVNGGRATAKSLARVARKATQGHSHTPTIEKGLWRAGMSTDFMDYMRGLTTVDQSHVGQYAHGKRTQFPIRQGRWR